MFLVYKLYMKNNKIKIESFISQEMYSKLEQFEAKHGLTKAEIMRRALAFWLSYIENFFPLVEKAGEELNNINKILNISNNNLQNFATELFDIAKNTKQSFESVKIASQEFAKQGLNLEETLNRTKNALILSKLSGIEISESVSILTSALNSFNSNVINSTNIINKLAQTDANFSISSRDLCEAIEKIGDKVQEANISLDELISLISAAQFATAGGGATIGNALKSIFLKLKKEEVIGELQKMGININNNDSVLEKIQKIANKFESLSSEDVSIITELIGGVYQINILKSLLKELNNKNSIYYQVLNLLQSK